VTETDANRARRLPPGPHGLPPELVERNQRERLIAAMAEVCGEGGYEKATVAEVARRAGVSTASFYRQFKDRRECLLASFEELFGRLLGEVERACEEVSTPAEKVKAGIATAVALLAADPPTARLLTLEIAAVGVDGARLRDAAVDRLSARLSGVRGDASTGGPAAPSAEWVAVAAATALVAKRIAAGEDLDPAELEVVFSTVDAAL
jgi:AcrR family transcriptional regulator